MNLVFGSVLLLTFIAPGLIFRFSYLQGPYSKQSFKPSAIDELFWALIPALFFHLAAVLIIEWVTVYTIKLDYVYSLITGDFPDTLNFVVIRSSLPLFLTYNILLITVSASLGLLVRKIVREKRWDLRFNFLRVNNDWDYVFSGEILDFPSVMGESENIELIKVDALVRSQEGTIIYSGILHDYFLSKDNGLDRIYLKLVHRRRLDEDLPARNGGEPVQRLDDRYYAMPGDLFVVFYKDVVNLNITYHRFTLIDEEVLIGKDEK